MTEGSKLVFSWALPGSPSGSGEVLKNYLRTLDVNEICILGEGSGSVGIDGKRSIQIAPWLEGMPRGRRFFRALLFPLLVVRVFWSLWRHKLRFDRVLVIYPDSRFLIIGFLVCKVCRVPFNVWFHNSYADNRSGLSRRVARIWERSICRSAEIVYCISDVLTYHFRTKYPEIEVKTLRHCAPSDLVVNTVREYQRPIVRRKLALSGTINASNMEATLRFLDSVCDTDFEFLRWRECDEFFGMLFSNPSSTSQWQS